MMLLSEAKVASMWESKGEAARRRRGWVGAMVLLDLEGEEFEGDDAGELLLAGCNNGSRGEAGCLHLSFFSAGS